jgi:hypothetical protein
VFHICKNVLSACVGKFSSWCWPLLASLICLNDMVAFWFGWKTDGCCSIAV